jgi:hypothetical protein
VNVSVLLHCEKPNNKQQKEGIHYENKQIDSNSCTRNRPQHHSGLRTGPRRRFAWRWTQFIVELAWRRQPQFLVVQFTQQQFILKLQFAKQQLLLRFVAKQQPWQLVLKLAAQQQFLQRQQPRHVGDTPIVRQPQRLHHLSWQLGRQRPRHLQQLALVDRRTAQHFAKRPQLQLVVERP